MHAMAILRLNAVHCPHGLLRLLLRVADFIELEPTDSMLPVFAFTMRAEVVIQPPDPPMPYDFDDWVELADND